MAPAHRAGVSPEPGAAGLPRPVSTSTANRRRVAAFDQAATRRARKYLARGTANRCPLAQARFDRAPPQ